MRIKNTPLGTGILILFFLANGITANAQKTMNDYLSDWKKVEAFQKKGLPQSALAEVEKIYTDASKNNNSPQVIKSILFKISLQFNQQENASDKNIRQIESETTKAKEPAKSILQSITAQMYWNYFQQNRYRIYQRTNTDNFKKEDIAKWATMDFHNKISQLYFASIDNKNLLQKSKLDPFDAIILKGNVRYLRPTLYDLLAHRALEYFKNDERDIVKASYSFEINNNKVFAPANEFVKEKFVSKDTFSLHFKALLIYQDLLAFHTGDENKDGLIEIDLDRVEFAKQYGVMPEKTELYINALKDIYSKNKNNPAAAQAAYLVAQQIYSEANEANESKKISSVYSI
ncbi:MAG: alpha-2-macroglobulin, partial [Ginsengibacter sp.]